MPSKEPLKTGEEEFLLMRALAASNLGIKT
jgi:hypothetical protein